MIKSNEEKQIHIIVGSFNIHLSGIIEADSFGGEKNKDLENSNCTTNYLDLIDIFRTLCSTIAEYILFSSVSGTFTKRNCAQNKIKSIKHIRMCCLNTTGINKKSIT